MKLLAAFRRSFFSLLRDNAGSVLSMSSTGRFPTVHLLLHVSRLGFAADGLMHNSTNWIYKNTQLCTYSLVHSKTWTVLTLKDSPRTKSVGLGLISTSSCLSLKNLALFWNTVLREIAATALSCQNWHSLLLLIRNSLRRLEFLTTYLLIHL